MARIPNTRTAVTRTPVSRTAATRTALPSWSNFGITYGQEFLGGSFSLTTIQSDLKYFKSVGIKNIKTAFAGITDTGNTAYTQAIASEAKKLGMYVVHGFGGDITTPSGLAALVAYAKSVQSLGIADMLAIGNELEGSAFVGGMSNAQVQTALIGLATSMKSAGVTLPLTYSFGWGAQDDWLAIGPSGLGGLDVIGMNMYGTWTVFQYYVNHYNSVFGSKWYMSEWSAENDFVYGPSGTGSYTEADWAREIMQRFNFMKANMTATQKSFFYTYKSGDDWHLLLADNVTFHLAWFVLIANT